MAPTTTITTPIPTGVTPDAIIQILHDHESYIKLTCPLLISFKFESGDPDSTATYNVTDKKPFGQTTFQLTLTNVGDGVETLVNAKPPMGTLTIKGKWCVADGNITEEVEIDAPFVMRKMVKGNTEKSHAEFHLELIKMATPAAA
jgi:hypothetical protein